MSVPIHTPQIYKDVNSDDGQWSEHGEGRFGPELRSKGGGKYATLGMQRSTVHGNSNAVIGRVEAKNTGVVPADGYHGLGLSVVAYKRIGKELKEIWNNHLIDSGNLDWWLSGDELPDRWVSGSVVVQIPDEYNPDFLDTWWVYKTSDTAGKVRIDGIGLHDYYGRTHRTILKDRIISGYTLRLHPRFLGRDFNAYSRFIDSNVVRIAKGQQVDVTLNAFINQQYGIAAAFTDRDVPASLTTLVAVKLLAHEGGDDFELLGQIGQYNNQFAGAEEDMTLLATKQFIAKKAYFQYELYFVSFSSLPSRALRAPFVVDVRDLEMVFSTSQQRETGAT